MGLVILHENGNFGCGSETQGERAGKKVDEKLPGQFGHGNGHNEPPANGTDSKHEGGNDNDEGEPINQSAEDERERWLGKFGRRGGEIAMAATVGRRSIRL